MTDSRQRHGAKALDRSSSVQLLPRLCVREAHEHRRCIVTHTGEKERERDFVNLCGPDTGLFRLTYEELWKSIRGTLDCTYVCVRERERQALPVEPPSNPISVCRLQSWEKALFLRVSGFFYTFRHYILILWGLLHFRHTGRVRLKNPRT